MRLIYSEYLCCPYKPCKDNDYGLNSNVCLGTTEDIRVLHNVTTRPMSAEYLTFPCRSLAAVSGLESLL